MVKSPESFREPRHYSNKGGHLERSDYWKAARKLSTQIFPSHEYSPTRLPPPTPATYVNIRSMRRISVTGK